VPSILADFTFGQALLTVLEIFILVIWVWLLITIMVDVFRDHELSGGWKAIWVFFLIFLPVITALIYLIVRGGGMRDRAIAHQRELQQATEQYIRHVANSPADELAKLSDLRDKGVLSEEEFQRLKGKVVA
jgi:NADH:ubiquinone oxidoreductase subunit 6 (subunit J)